MKTGNITLSGLLILAALATMGCVRTHSDVVISQPKPLQVDVNLNGKLTLVIQDARHDMQYIAGASPTASTTPMTVGTSQPAATTAPHAPATAPGTTSTQPNSLRIVPRIPMATGIEPTACLTPIAFADDIPPAQMKTKQQVLAELREDYPRLRALLIKHLIGEAHTGYVVARGTLSAKEKKLIHKDNGYRHRLYQIVGKSTGQSVAAVGLIYFQVRLRYLPNGVWVQQLNNATGQWVWVHWLK